MTPFFDGQVRPDSRDVDRLDVGAASGYVRPGLSNRLRSLPKSVDEHLLVSGRFRRSLEGSQFGFGAFQVSEGIVRFTGRGATLTGEGQEQAFGDRVESVDRYSRSEVTRHPAEAPIPAFARAHGSPTPGTPDESLEQRAGVIRRSLRRMRKLRGLEQGAVYQRFVSGRIMPGTDRDLAEVDAVLEYLRDRRVSDVWVDDRSDLPPRRTGRSFPECSADSRRVLVRMKPAVFSFRIAGRDFRHRPDTETDRSLLSVGEMRGVTLPFHRGEGQKDVSGHPTFRGSRVDVLRDRYYLAPGILDPFDDRQGSRHLHPGKPVDLRDDDAVKFAAFDSSDDLFKDRTTGSATGDVQLGREHLDRPAPELGEGPDSLLLKLRRDKMLASSDAGNPPIPGQSHDGDHNGYLCPSTTGRRKVSVVILAAIAALLLLGGEAEAKIDCGGQTRTWEQHWSWAKNLRGGYSIPAWAKDKHRFSVVCAAGPNHRAIMRTRWKRIKRSILPPNHDLFVRIGRCEQPGSGYMGINWSHTGPTYQGGLGFYYRTWSGYKYPGMPSNAGYASWRQQMKVANRLLRLYGTSPWGCA